MTTIKAMPRLAVSRAQAVSLVVAMVAMVSSCGGGGVVGSGGTGRAAGVTVGTVNGFGSVIVDGLVYDNRSAPVVSETAPGVDTIAEVRLGHRVSVEYESAGVASLIRVEAAVVGTVASVASPGVFSILGQTVSANMNGLVGPITQFGGGYARAADVHAADPVEIHGILVRRNGSYTIQATRIEKLAAAPAYLRVTGLVSGVGTAGPGLLNLGALGVDIAGSTIVPPGTVVVEGQAVTVTAVPAALTQLASGGLRLKAVQTRVRQLTGGDLDAYVSGSLSHLDAVAKRFTLGSLVVRYADASISPIGAGLAEGLYVLVRGAKAADGSLTAATVTLRNAGSDEESELKGNISGYIAATRHFVVRGVAVDASAASIQGCPATGLADGVFVEVHGMLVSSGVMAKTVGCESEAPGSIVERTGVASSVDTVGKTFGLSRSGGSISVTWSANTFFNGVTPLTLNGKTVQVEGQLSGAVLNASKIELED
ncbi:MAG: DUF5666 domain-containing protein [Burkholderiales bacterium]